MSQVVGDLVGPGDAAAGHHPPAVGGLVTVEERDGRPAPRTGGRLTSAQAEVSRKKAGPAALRRALC